MPRDDYTREAVNEHTRNESVRFYCSTNGGNEKESGEEWRRRCYRDTVGEIRIDRFLQRQRGRLFINKHRRMSRKNVDCLEKNTDSGPRRKTDRPCLLPAGRRTPRRKLTKPVNKFPRNESGRFINVREKTGNDQFRRITRGESAGLIRSGSGFFLMAATGS